MTVYTKYVDANGNITITQGDENISIKIRGREGTVITEAEAFEIVAEQQK